MMECLGPVTASELGARLGRDVRIELAALEGEGQVFEGWYTSPKKDEVEWVTGAILARIHRLTMGRLRREIEPVTQSQFMNFWAAGSIRRRALSCMGPTECSRLCGRCRVTRRRLPHGEPEIFGKRIVDYGAENLDDLCLSGEVAWARLALHPALADAARRVRPTKIAPISFFLRRMRIGW